MGLKDTLFGKTETPRQIPLDKIEAEKLDIEEQSERAIKAGRQLVQRASDVAEEASFEQQKISTGILNRALPGFSEMQQQLRSVFDDAATSPYEIPEDALDFLKQQAGELGISGGFGGLSEFGRFNQLRNLGIQSLNLGNQRMQLANNLFRNLVTSSGAVNPVSPMAFLPTTSQFIGASQFNIGNELSTDVFNAQAKQQFEQAQENERAAKASRRGIIPGIMGGAQAGFQMSGGNPWGALIGGIAGGAEAGILRKPGSGSGLFSGDNPIMSGGGGFGGMSGMMNFGSMFGGGSGGGNTMPSLPPIPSPGGYGGDSYNLFNQ